MGTSRARATAAGTWPGASSLSAEKSGKTDSSKVRNVVQSFSDFIDFRCGRTDMQLQNYATKNAGCQGEIRRNLVWRQAKMPAQL
jgi:hypothetical protein